MIVGAHPILYRSNTEADRALLRDVLKFPYADAVACTEIHEEHWGRLVDITLPSDAALGVYQATHARPE